MVGTAIELLFSKKVPVQTGDGSGGRGVFHLAVMGPAGDCFAFLGSPE